MHGLTSGVFEHLGITFIMEVDQRVAYTHRILIRALIKKYKTVMVECKQSVKDLAGNKWDLGVLKELSTDDFWTCAKKDGIGYYGYAYLGLDKRIDF